MEAPNFESIFECISDGVNKVLVLVLVLINLYVYSYVLIVRINFKCVLIR